MIIPRQIERVLRDRKLTPEEIAREKLVRRQIEEEFPPARENDDARESDQS